MKSDHRAGLVDAGPERVEHWVGEVAARGWPGAKRDDSSPPVQRPLQFGHRSVGIDQRQQGRGVDAPISIEAPFVVQPAVEGRQVGVQQIGVIDHEMLHAHGQCGEQHSGLHVLGVEHLDPGGSGHVFGAVRFGHLAALDRLASALALLHGSEHLPQHPGLGGGVEAAVLQEGKPPVADVHLLGAIGLDHRPHCPISERRVDVSGKGVSGFVVVVVGIEHPISQIHAHRLGPLGLAK